MRIEAVIILIALVFGGFRHSRLNDLRREARHLDDSIPMGGSGDGIDRMEGGTEAAGRTGSQTIPAELVNRLRAEFAGRGALHPREPGSNAEAIEIAFIRELSQLDRDGAMELLGELQAAGSAAGGSADGLSDYCLRLFVNANPPEALALLEGFPHLEGRAYFAADAFKLWAVHRPAEAIAWFEEQEKKGGYAASEPQVIQELIKTQCRIDPSGAMERMSSVDPKTVSRMGQVVATGLRSSREHQEFLSALERGDRRFPESTAIPVVRASYIEGLINQLFLWPFDEAAPLVETAFRSDEREKLVQKIAEASSLGDPEPWANWLARVDSPPGPRHPLVRLAGRWAERDPDAAGAWLGKMSAGALRDEATQAYDGVVLRMAPHPE